MNFQIPCETFLRLANVPQYFAAKWAQEEVTALRCVRIEAKNGSLYAIASNGKIAAIVSLGATDQPDGAIHLTLEPSVMTQCEMEKAFNSNIHVVGVRELAIVSAKTTMGFNCPASFGYFMNAATHLENWRNWPSSEEIKRTKGAMSWTLQDMISLNASSPSGRINFPEFIDANKPVVLRDNEFDNWVGIFMPNRVDDNGKVYTVEPSALPEWW